MAKRKIDAKKLLAAGEDAHLQSFDDVVEAQRGRVGSERFAEIDVDRIDNNPMQPRMNVDEEHLKELAASIKEHGLIQPIAVKATANGRFVLKAGQRRWLAHKLAGIEKIKAVIEEEEGTASPQRELFEVAMIENTQRDNLDPLEFALSVREAIDAGLYASIAELAKAIGKSKSYISKVMKVLALCPKVVEDLRTNHSTNDIETLYEIQKIRDCPTQERVYFDFIARKIDRSDVRALLQKEKNDVSHAKPPVSVSRKGKKISMHIDLSGLNIADSAAAERQLKEAVEKMVVRGERIVGIDEDTRKTLMRLDKCGREEKDELLFKLAESLKEEA